MASTNGLKGNRLKGKTVILAAPAGGLEPAVLPIKASGGTVNYADSLSVGAYSLVGKDITDVKTSASIAYADSLSVGAYLISGKSITDALAKNDSLSVGSYVLAGKTVSDSVVRADSLSVGAYTVSGKTISDVVARADSLSVGNYVVSGKDITDVLTGGGVTYADNLLTGNYVVAGQSISDDLVPYPVNIGGGGYFNHLDRIRRLKDKKKKEELEAKEIYEEILAINDAQLKAAAVRLIKPFTESKAKTPQVKSVDWEAIEYDKYRVEALIKLWEEQVQINEEDEEILWLL